MVVPTLLLLVCSNIFGLVAANSFAISAHREKVALTSAKRSETGEIPNEIDHALFWFGNFTVGDSQNLDLLVDTGSSDLIVNPGEYAKPSIACEPYNGQKHFTITYEGVSPTGFGFEELNGTVHRDTVSAGGLSATNQTIGEVTSFKYSDTKPKPYGYLGQGIIGFQGKDNSAFVPEGLPWIFSLCKDKIISECRFALAFGTNGTGQIVVGEVDEKLIKGSLAYSPFVLVGYTVLGDVLLNGKAIYENQIIVMDVGTNNIQGPLGQTNKIFKKLGYHYTEQTGSSGGGGPTITNSRASSPCDQPPELAFRFPPESSLTRGQTNQIFTVSKNVWDVHDHGNNNCTSILTGTNFLEKDAGAIEWLVGQPLFAGHYIDFDIAGKRIGYGNLANPETGT